MPYLDGVRIRPRKGKPSRMWGVGLRNVSAVATPQSATTAVVERLHIIQQLYSMA